MFRLDCIRFVRKVLQLINQDKAGKEYWDTNWASQATRFVDPRAKGLTNAVNERLHRLLSKVLSGTQTQKQRLLEVGCANSSWLPYFALHYGFDVTGLDYSPQGCEQERELLSVAGVEGEVVCADLYAPPSSLESAFDVVFSLGVVEHFTDTAACVRALSAFLRPGGMLITVIPNMSGSVGLLQRLCDRAVYENHVPLSADELRCAHEAASLSVMESRYFLSTNYFVANVRRQSKSVGNLVKRATVGICGRVSMVVWWIEEFTGEWPKSRLCSPYVFCLAKK